MPCKRQTARTELTHILPSFLDAPGGPLAALSRRCIYKNTLAPQPPGSQDRLDPNFRKKNRVTEVRLTRFSPSPSSCSTPAFGSPLFPWHSPLSPCSPSGPGNRRTKVLRPRRLRTTLPHIISLTLTWLGIPMSSYDQIIPSKHPIQRPYDEEKEDEGEFMPGIGGGGIGRVKIADFGLSKVVWEESTMTALRHRRLHGARDRQGRAVLQVGRHVGPLGCVLYTLLCGFPALLRRRVDLGAHPKRWPRATTPF
ncbi:hypothetical protein L1887_61823 [Cichorium endivia]|nr:hypothetical protein L1887_61823 [Cichorium endivia]